MTIETSENLENQQSIPTLSREEMLTSLFEIRLKTAERVANIEVLKTSQKEENNAIKKLELAEAELIQRLESNQIVLNVDIHTSVDDGENDGEYPSDDELSEFDDPEDKEEPEPLQIEGDTEPLDVEIVEPEKTEETEESESE